MTPSGLLRWTITVRPDGRRLAGGAVPTLIAWNGPHPVDSLPPTGIALASLRLGALPPTVAASIPERVQTGGDVPLVLRLSTPNGPVELRGVE
jgi:hypothetical protein